jgi:hypothetical protein
MKILALRNWGKMERIIRSIMIKPNILGAKNGVIV